MRLGAQLLERVPNPFFGTIPRSSSLGEPTITRAQLLKPFPQFTTVSFYRNNVGNTNYHAFQAKLEKRFSRGLSLLASYTRSKLIDEASSVFDAAVLTGPVADFPVADSFNRKLERDLSSGDMSNVFVLSAAYDLPARRGLFGGWQIAGILTLESGLPLPVTQNTNLNAFAGFGTQRPNRLRNANLPAGGRRTARYFDTDAFALAPQFTLGNSSRNPVRGPGYQAADLMIAEENSSHGKDCSGISCGSLQFHEHTVTRKSQYRLWLSRLRVDHIGRRSTRCAARSQAAFLSLSLTTAFGAR